MKHHKAVWPSEAAMFADFVGVAKALGFAIYPECCGHDLVMVAPEMPAGLRSPLRAGDQVVVEGKLQASLGLLTQAMPPAHRQAPVKRSASWYVALVPDHSWEFAAVARALGVVVMAWSPPPVGDSRLAAMQHRSQRERAWAWLALHRQDGDRLVLPEVQVDVTPGHPSPRMVTDWKIAAVKICLLGKERKLTAEDVPAPMRRRFLDRGWVSREGRGKGVVFTLLDVWDRPDLAYPEIARALQGGDA